MGLQRQRLARRRKSLGYSQEQLAERLGVERSTVVRWERGATDPQPWVRPKLVQVLQVSADELDDLLIADDTRPADSTRQFEHASPRPIGLALADGVRLATPRPTAPTTTNEDGAGSGGRDVPLDFAEADDEAVLALMEEFTAADMATRRDVLGTMSVLSGAALTQPLRLWASLPAATPARTGRVGTTELDDLERVVPLFRRWDAATGGGVRRKAAVGQLNAVCEALRGQKSGQIRRRLFQAAAELAQIAGWMSYDSRIYGAAQRYYLLGLHACQHAGARDLGAKIIGDVTQMSTALGRYDDSLELTRTALYSLPPSHATVVRSELLGLEARAYAHLPDKETSARRAVDACLEAYEEAATQVRPDWVHYMNQAEADCLAANTHIQLALAAGDPKHAHHAERAEHHTRRALDARGQTYTRSGVLDLARLAKVRLAQHEPVESAQVASQAVDLATGLASAVAVEWLISVCAGLTTRYGDVPEVAELADRIRGYVRDTAPQREHELIAS